MGLLKHYKGKYSPRVDKCLLNKKDKPKIARLNLEAFFSAFLILAYGTGLSLLVLVVEMVIGRKVSLR